MKESKQSFCNASDHSARRAAPLGCRCKSLTTSREKRHWCYMHLSLFMRMKDCKQSFCNALDHSASGAAPHGCRSKSLTTLALCYVQRTQSYRVHEETKRSPLRKPTDQRERPESMKQLMQSSMASNSLWKMGENHPKNQPFSWPSRPEVAISLGSEKARVSN